MNLITQTPTYKAVFDAISAMTAGTGYVTRGCAPTANGAGSLQVNIAAGAYVAGGTPVAYAGGNIVMSAAHATLPRRDLVYFSSAGVLSKLSGTAATVPLPPAIPAGACPLAIAAIPALATDFTAGAPLAYVEDISQTRVDMAVGVSARAVGVVADGTTDDTAALNAAIVAANGGKVFLPAGTIKFTAALTCAISGTELIGAGMGKTILKAGAAVNGIIMSTGANFGRIADLEIDGNSVGLTGITLYDAGRSVLSRVYVHNFTLDGFRFNITFGSPTGNNNFIRLEYCRSSANTLRGYAVPTNQSDNNGLVFLDCEAQNNGASGLLYKGVGLRVFGGQYSTNGRYGIELGEAADASYTVDGLVLFPWLEANTLGGVGETKSVRHRILTGVPVPPVGSFTVIPVGASSGIHEFVDNGGSTSSAMLVIQGEEVGGPLGALSIGGSGAAYGVVEQIGVVTSAWNPGNLVAGAQVALTIAMPAGTVARMTDTAHVGADVDILDQQLTAYVRASNSVRVVLRNGTAGAINLGAFNVRVEVVKH